MKAVSWRLSVCGFVLSAAAWPQVPLPAGVNEGAGIVKNRQWAIALGKSLFWDMQAGSDGNSCASCHFAAGADVRLTNQLNPGIKDVSMGPQGDSRFGSTRSDTRQVALGFMPSGQPAASNYRLRPGDFPLHKLQDENNPNSPIVTTTNDRISSSGSYGQRFGSFRPLGQEDLCFNPDASIYRAGGHAARQVEPRNTPTTINAVYNSRQFWDGRAANLFNGVGVFGMRDINGDPNKRLIQLNPDGSKSLTYLQLENGSLASQAVGPILSDLEMSCAGRTFADVARRLFTTVPLQGQRVAPTDSVLGPYAAANGGLQIRYNYIYMIQQAFDSKWWAAPGLYRIQNGALSNASLANGYAQMEINFPMFWGIAIMMYESTLISEQSEYDQLIARGDLVVTRLAGCAPGAGRTVDPLLVRGCSIFFAAPGRPVEPATATNTNPSRGQGCLFCHTAQGRAGDRFSEAMIQPGQAVHQRLLNVPDITGRFDLRDNGFANIALRPPHTDIFLGGTDPYGNPLSYGRQYRAFLNSGGTNQSLLIDPELRTAVLAGNGPGNPVPPFNGAGTPGTFYKLEVDGATKVPTLRNVALTPPYFSWGGYPDLRQAMRVYNRGMNQRTITPANRALEAPPGSACVSGDWSGSGPEDANGRTSWPINSTDCGTNTTGLIVPLNMSDCDANSGPNATCLQQGRTAANDDLAALTRFMLALTDARVQCDQAPFDHPSLTLRTGHVTADRDRDGKADDSTFTLPAVGAAGYPTGSNFCIPNSGSLFAPGMQGRTGGR